MDEIKRYKNKIRRVSKHSLTMNESTRLSMLEVYRRAVSMIKSIAKELGLDSCEKCGK